MNNAQLVNQDSGNCEWYTPPEIIEAARSTMGSIDLDPFSSSIANERVKARRYYTEKDDGFEQEWFGNVWCNHPFGRTTNPLIAPKIISEYEGDKMGQACMICFAATSEKWFSPLLAYPQCYIKGRVNYYLPDGTKKKGVTKGSVVTYFGEDLDSFYDNFSVFGEIKIAYRK